MTEHDARHFVLISVPPIDRSPMWQRQGPAVVDRMQKRVHGNAMQCIVYIWMVSHEADYVFVLQSITSSWRQLSIAWETSCQATFICLMHGILFLIS